MYMNLSMISIRTFCQYGEINALYCFIILHSCIIIRLFEGVGLELLTTPEGNTLNSMISSVRIRNPSLRKYYDEGNTPHPLRRSPRLAGYHNMFDWLDYSLLFPRNLLYCTVAKREGQSSLVPPPPPPPISLWIATPTSSNCSPSISRRTLRSRLNRTMKKGCSNLDKTANSTVNINVRVSKSYCLGCCVY